MPELRQNIITGDWVVVAPERAKRPQDFIKTRNPHDHPKDDCPFCVGTEKYRQNKRVRQVASEHVYVIENRYPAFEENELGESTKCYYAEGGFYRARPSSGDHEVVVVKDHDLSLPKFSKTVATDLFQVIRDRFLWIKQHEQVVSLIPIYNHGGEAGASVVHPHAQLFASGIVANTVGREMHGAEHYYDINGSCVYCDMVSHELEQRTRLVYENDAFVAINFFASRFPFETWVIPRRHESQFEHATNTHLEYLADAMMAVLNRLDTVLHNPSLNFYIHTLPTIVDGSASYHWHVEITPRVTTYGGFEIGSDVIINVMPPEAAAAYLRGEEATKKSLPVMFMWNSPC